MIDLAQFRANPDAFRTAWANRGLSVDVAELVSHDERVRALKHQAETLKAEQNAASKAIGQAAKNGQDVNAAKEKARTLGDQAKAIDEQRAAAERELEERILQLPNPCLPSTPVGKDAGAN